MRKSWMDKRKEVTELIKSISNINGGDDEQWLKEYTNDVLNDWAHNYDAAIACFKDVLAQGQLHGKA